MNCNGLFLRVLVLPFILIVVVISLLWNIVRFVKDFVIYGGEWITLRKDDKPTIGKIYAELKRREKEDAA